MFPNEKCEFLRAAHKTEGRAVELHKRAVRRAFPQPAGPPLCAACRPSFLCSPPARGKFMLFIWKHGPPACPALHLVLINSDTQDPWLPSVLPVYYEEKPQNLPWKKPENNFKKQTYIQNVQNKPKPNLKCTLLAIARKNWSNMHYLHQIFKKLKSVFKHTGNLQVG